MSDDQSAVNSSTQGAETSSGTATTEAAAVSTASNRTTCGPLCGLLVGLLAGGIVWGLLWQFEPDNPRRQPFSVPEEVLAKTQGYVVPPREIQVEIEQHSKRVAVLNDTFFLGAFGLLLGAGLGLAHGIYRRSAVAIACGTICGGLIAMIVGCAAGVAGHFAFDLLPVKTSWQPLVVTIAGQGVMLAILGAGVGLALGLVAGQGVRTLNFLIFGLIAGALAGVVFAIASSLLTPDTGTNVAIPDQMGRGRLLWALVIGAIIGGLVPAARAPQKPEGQG